MSDLINHPQHYTSHPSGLECIEVTRHMSFCLGNVVKYVWRADHKNGLQDLQKARWYLADLLDDNGHVEHDWGKFAALLQRAGRAEESTRGAGWSRSQFFYAIAGGRLPAAMRYLEAMIAAAAVAQKEVS